MQLELMTSALVESPPHRYYTIRTHFTETEARILISEVVVIAVIAMPAYNIVGTQLPATSVKYGSGCHPHVV